MKLKWGDFIIFAMILSVISVMFFSGVIKNDDSVIAEISQDGQVLYDINLLTLNESTEIYLDDGEVLIVAEQGSIRFVESDCNDKVCVNTSWISSRGQIAACLPNKILIKIVGENPEVDVVIN